MIYLPMADAAARQTCFMLLRPTQLQGLFQVMLT